MTKRLPVTSGRLVALIIGVPLALLVIGLAGLHEVAYAGEGTYPVRLNLPAHGRPVTVLVDSGTLNGGQTGGNRLRLTGTARYSLIRSTVTWHATPSGVAVYSRCHFVVGQCSFTYQVGLPAGSPAFLSDSSGDITIMGLTSADVRVFDNSGNVTLGFAKVPGRVRVSDRFGDVTLVLPPGRTAYRVSAHSTFGNTRISVPTSSASAHMITVTDPTGNISISN